MLARTQRRLVFLAGFTVSVCAAWFLFRSATVSSAPSANVQSGEFLKRETATVVDLPQVMGIAASVQTQAKSLPTPVSVRQILPRLEQTVADWRKYQPQKMTIAPYADLALEFEMTSVREENGRTIWRGRNALSGAFLVTVATQNEWHAVLEIPAASNFEFHISGQSATVTEKDTTVLCGNDRLLSAAAVSGGSVDPTSPSTDDTKDSTGTQANTVDVIFFYDAATFSASGKSAQLIETTIVASVEAANVVLQNSAVRNLRWHYVAAYQVPDYSATDKLQDDLNEITNSDNIVGKFVADKCALHGVDQAVLYVNNRRKDNYDGLAWVPNSQGTVAHFSAMVWNSGYVILAHEMAHNFGCHHDRQTEAATDGDGKYGYGFNFKLNGNDCGTIMSYAPTRVPFFSNPDVAYAGIRLGVSEDQPRAANNSRVLRENAQLMAGSREASQEPIIISQPQSATVSRGAGFALNVSAAGNGLVFQWKKDGVDIPGANDVVFSKSSASGGDEGVYNVVVSNAVGQASSAPASVAVAESVSTPSAATGASTGSSAGGGALAPWALAMLAVFGSLRLIGCARRTR